MGNIACIVGMDAYGDGLGTKEAQVKVKKFSSTKYIPDSAFDGLVSLVIYKCVWWQNRWWSVVDENLDLLTLQFNPYHQKEYFVQVNYLRSPKTLLHWGGD